MSFRHASFKTSTGAWVDIRIRNGKYIVQVDTESSTVATEYEVWSFIQKHDPYVLSTLRTYPWLEHRALSERADLLLSIGQARFDSLVEQLNEKVLMLFHEAMTTISARRASYSKLRARRTSSKFNAWIEVMSRVIVPYYDDPLQLYVRAFPSPFEANTWQLRIRLPAVSNLVAITMQKGYDTLVQHMSMRHDYRPLSSCLTKKPHLCRCGFFT